MIDMDFTSHFDIAGNVKHIDKVGPLNELKDSEHGTMVTGLIAASGNNGGGLTDALLRVELGPGEYVLFVDGGSRDAAGEFSLWFQAATADGDCPDP